MLYLDPAIVAELTIDITEGRGGATCEFTQPKVSDKRIASQFSQLSRAMTGSVVDKHGLEADETLLLVLGGLLHLGSSKQHSIPLVIAAARALIDDDPMAILTLTALANEAGLSRYQFLRSFARVTGLTPHAYKVAALSGFSDQSHMTRLFVRSFGVTPGTYAKAIG
ncbi:Transcriptional regulator, AraC family [Candidatus Burkholderia brachyanthoides]|nr:Transcriptional regulator, AraC family [Candidatus Burkholderia brachyanthoides]